MKFRDKQNREIEINLVMAESRIDWTKDFYNVGGLEMSEADGAFLVDNIDDVEAEARDYINHVGDYAELNDDGTTKNEANELYINGHYAGRC